MKSRSTSTELRFGYGEGSRPTRAATKECKLHCDSMGLIICGANGVEVEFGNGDEANWLHSPRVVLFRSQWSGQRLWAGERTCANAPIGVEVGQICLRVYGLNGNAVRKGGRHFHKHCFSQIL